MRKGKKDFRVQLLRWWVRDRKLTPTERLSSRVGYMGAGFLMAGQWTVEPVLFIIGFCCVLFHILIVFYHYKKFPIPYLHFLGGQHQR